MAASAVDLPSATPYVKYNIRTVVSGTRLSLREYLSLQQRRVDGEQGLDSIILEQSAIVLTDLRSLRRRVREISDNARRHRWYKIAVGSGIATVAPGISSLLIGLVLKGDLMLNKRKASSSVKLWPHAKLTVTILLSLFSAAYICYNEVIVRTGDSIASKLDLIYQQVENGGQTLKNSDEGVLDGWKWNVLYRF